MPCDCHGVVDENMQPPAAYPDDEGYLPQQYRMSECYGRGLGWWQYAWDESVTDAMLCAQYADVLDVKIFDNVTWMQAIKIVSGYALNDAETME